MTFRGQSSGEVGLEETLGQLRVKSKSLQECQNLSAILDITVRETRKILESDRMVIYRFLPDGDGVVLEESVDPAWKPIQGQLIYDPCFQEKWSEPYRQGRVSILENIHAQPLVPCYKDLLTRLQIQANLVVPILVPSQNQNCTSTTLPNLWGLLIAHQCRCPRQWQPLEMKFLQQISLQLGMVLRYGKEDQQSLNLRSPQDQQTQFPLRTLKLTKPVVPNSSSQQNLIKPGFQGNVSTADLIGFDRLQTPIWIFDIENLKMWWANTAALYIWDAQSRKELLNRNFSDISEATQIRLNGYIQQFEQGKTTTENWTFYPGGKPVSVRCLCSGILIEDGRIAMLVEGSTEANPIDPETLRSIEAMRHTSLMISLYTIVGVPLMQNPAAQRCYGDTLHPNLLIENVFLSHFLDPDVGLQAMETIQAGEVFSIETEVSTTQGVRWHGLDARCTRDPVTGNAMILVNERDITERQIALEERQKAEIELRWKEALLRAMTDTSLLAFFVVDNRTDQILYCNHRFCEIWGLEHLEEQMQRGELKSNDIIPYCVQLISDVPAFAKACKPLQSEENRFTLEDQILFLDGRTIRRFSSQIRDNSDRYFGRLYVFEDISERIQAEAALRESENRWQYALEGNQDGVWDWNAETNEVFFSRRWKEMLGYTEAEISNSLNEWDKRVHPDDKAEVYQALEQHFRGETEQYISEHRVQCKDGTYKWILDRGQVQSRNGEGRPLRVIGTHTDITERKCMDKALRESEERYRSLIAALTEGIVLQQADGQIIACNDSAEKILGLTVDQMIGRTSVDPRWQAIHEDGSPFLGETHPALVTLRTGQPQFNVVMGVYKPDGCLTWISINSQPLFHPNQLQPYAVVTSFTDITIRKETEQALLQQTQRERMINTITQRIRQSLDLDEILNTTVAEVQTFLQTDRVFIYQFNSDWSGVVVKESVAEGWEPILNQYFKDTYFVEMDGQCYQQGIVKATSDIYAVKLTPCHLELLEQLNVRAKIVVPILQNVSRDHLLSSMLGQENRLWGLLIAHQCSSSREWHPQEKEMLQQLATQVAIAIQQSELHQQLQVANQQLENLAMIDQLTQIANRRCFDLGLNQAWHHLSREQQPLSLLLCDIDYFKQYNDTYGHLEGDTCLKRIAQGLKQSVQRATDLVARYGGEEFAILLLNTEGDQAFKVAEKIHETIQKIKIPHQASKVDSQVTLSIGIATVIPTTNLAIIDLVNTADQALYKSKSEGRNRSSIGYIELGNREQGNRFRI